MDSQEIPSSLQRSDRCHTTVYSISEYIDGGLTAGEARAIAEHLAGCKPCESMRAEIDQLRVLARDLPEHSPRAVLWTRVRAEIESEIISDRKRRREFRKQNRGGTAVWGQGEPESPAVGWCYCARGTACGYSAMTFGRMEILRAGSHLQPFQRSWLMIRF